MNSKLPKYVFVISMIMAYGGDLFAQNTKGKIVNYEAKGNLEVSHEIGCVGYSKLNNKLTAADLYQGLAHCLHDGNIDTAAELFILAGSYATFDKLRVADKSAQQAHTVLTMNAMENASAEAKNQLMQTLSAKLAKGSVGLKENCSAVRKIGRPDYFPRYMIQHGMGAFGGPQKNAGIVSDFKPSEAWEKALELYLHCSEAGA